MQCTRIQAVKSKIVLPLIQERNNSRKHPRGVRTRRGGQKQFNCRKEEEFSSNTYLELTADCQYVMLKNL